MNKTESQSNTATETTNTTSALVKVQPIKKIWLPKFLKLDGIEALRRLRSHKDGEAHFPGIKTATLELSEGVVRQSDDYFAKRQELVINTGGGRFGKFGESATDAVTELLGLEEDRALKRISAAVRKTLEDEGNRTELPAIIKLMHRVINRHAVVNYVMSVMHYVHHGLIHRRVKKSDDGNLLSFFEEMRGGKKPEFTDERAIGSLRGRIQKSVERKNNSILELAAVTDCLICEEGPKEGKKIVQNLLKGLYQDELLYWNAVDLVKVATKHVVKIGTSANERTTAAVVVVSDNPLIPHACWSKEAGNIGVIVVQNMAGNTAVYVDQKIPNLSLWKLWEMLQILELLALGWTPAQIGTQDLYIEEGHEDIRDKWKFIGRKRKIMNGFSQEDVPKTAIPLEKILYAIQHAFHAYGIPKWHGEHGTETSRRAEKSAPVPTAEPAIPKEEAGTNDLEDALKKGISRKSRGKKSSAPKAEKPAEAAEKSTG
ncbi:MAG: hypothetical protein HYS57_02310 [Parcubacteria group bacterium]|nr:hypothetical protein [Parcubacteria group bacterium]